MESLNLNNGELKTSSKGVTASGKLLIGVTGGVGLALSVICLPFVTPALRKVCLPYVPATTIQVQNVISILKRCTGKVLDVGSGDGRIVIAAAKENFIAHGVELNPWLVQYSRLNSIINGVYGKTSFHRRDLWKFDMRPYNTIVIFGVEEMMESLESKLKREVLADTAIIACRFPLRNLQPIETVGQGVDTVWYYRVK